MLAASWFTQQLVFNGLIDGMVFGLVAMGIVLVYRSTRVINFAVTSLGFLGAGLFALLVAQYNTPLWIGAVVGLSVGVLYGAVIELGIIRRLFTAPRVIVLVATVGIAQLSLAIWAALPDIDKPGARFPVPIGSSHSIGSVRISGPQLSILIVVPLVAVGLGWVLNRTALGKAVKASAENPDLARLDGISPKLVSTAVWAIAGGVATIALVLLGGQAGSAQNIDNLGPSTLVRALAAAVIAGMVSFPRAFLAGIAIGIVQALVTFNFITAPGLTDFLLLIAVMIAVYWQSRQGRGETQSFAFGARAKPIPERLRQIWWIRQIDRLALVLLGIGAIILPLVITSPSKHLLYTSILGFALCGLSLTVLTGWSGQLSLGQMAFAGVGAFLTAGFMRGINVDIGWHENRVLHAGIEPLRFGPSLLFAVLITALLAVLLGAGALRVKGLYLAVVTYAFAVAATQYLYGRPILSANFTTTVPMPRGEVFGLDITSQRSYYFFVLAVVAVVAIVVSRLRSSGVGRSTIAVRDNPETASAYTLSASRIKLRTFALSGGIAGLGGALLAANIQAVPTDRYFGVLESLMLVSIVVIGGLGSVAGTLLGAIWVIGLPTFFPDNDLVPLFTSSIGLLVLLLYFPGGLIQIGYGAAADDHRVDGGTARSGTSEAAPHRPDVAGEESRTASRRRPGPPGDRRRRSIRREHRRRPRVDRGGRRRGRRADRHERRREVDAHERDDRSGALVGIGRSPGYIGHETSVQARAALGLGRSFQSATLFPELTVRDTVLVALEARGHTGMLSTALFSPVAIRRERARRSEADELIDFLGLGRYADDYIANLSTGTRRIVELAGLLALDARVLCLDEPTAGVAQRETEAFGPLILEIRRELGASMLIIEHDMPLIMSISDRVYCLELGKVIAEGLPSTVRNDPKVVASYLGTDDRSINRSGAIPTADEVVTQ